MKKSKIIEFARKNGYDTVSSLGKWKGYDAYEPIMKGATEEEPAFTGPPLMILVKGDEIRMSTPDEAYEQMESAADEDVEKFNPYHDSRGRFASANSATSFTWKPGQGAMYDNAIAREKERHAAGSGNASEADTPRMKTIHGIEDNIRDQFYESAAVVDKDGNVVFQKSGAANQVGFTRMECFMMRDNTLTHNHPGSSMFSTEDLVCFTQNNMEEIRATTREGTTYSIKRGKDYTQDRAWQFVSQYEGERKIAHRIAQRELDQRGFQGKIMDGEITHEYANREFGKVVTREMINYCTKNASQYGLEYNVEKRAVNNKYNLEVFTGKSAGDEDVMILDAESNARDEAAFNEWLGGITGPEPAKKSHNKGNSVLFIGAKITGAGSLAIAGGEDEDEFHVTLAYGHFDRNGADEDAIDVKVQSAIDEIREFIPDEIRFDAIGRFQASEHSDGQDVIYAQVAAGQLEKAHEELLKALKRQGIKLEDTFSTYKPHMTLAYIYPGKLHKLSKINVTGSIKKLMIGHGIESSHENNYTILKTDEDKRLVFGWASISITVAGEQLEDRQADMIDPEDLEEAAYEYVLEFRDTGEEHIPSMRKKGKLVESCVLTAEKQKAMGIPEGTVPVGWWIGFKIEDDAAWERVKNGTYKMFSIEGKANRIPVVKAQRNYDEFPSYSMWLEENLDATIEEQREAKEHFRKKNPVAKSFDDIVEKFNPYHDSRGRFASSSSGSSATSTGATIDSFREELKNARLWDSENNKELFNKSIDFYSNHQNGVASEENFMIDTMATFEQMPRRPRRKPDYTSYSRDGKVSSEYWYTDEGVIRGSSHWGTGVSSCDWALKLSDNSVVYGGREYRTVANTHKYYGMAKWNEFVHKTDVVEINGKQVLTSFENVSGKNRMTVDGKMYELNEFSRKWDLIGKSFAKSFDEILETK